MSKAEIIKSVAQSTGMSQKSVATVVDETLHTITEFLKAGEEVKFVGFGSFSVKRRPDRIGRNPRTGQEVHIGAKDVVKFKPGTHLASAVA
ncbi:MAG: HU family DNA-binding protein [Salinarimonadaceae bacterium]|nr:MAG: HU family DNA-binding protein [Salinarimonadaceae bacterium]